MKRNFSLAVILLACLAPPAFAQEDGEITTTRQASNAGASLSASSADASQNIMLARSSADYRVTPGDVYTLAYAAGGAPVSYVITVDNTYRIRVSNLGIISGAGKTFIQLKNEIETIVANNYPLSGVQLVLTQPSVFRVYVKGEVYTVGEVPAWGLSRLSSLAGGNLTGRASLRDIRVRSSGGQARVYDLFKARRFGDLSQDPYLRPGDEVTFNRVGRVVTIGGAVERPGAYQILEGEQLRDMVESYASGFTPVADKTRITLVRYVGSAEVSGDRILLSEQDVAENYELRDYDAITIPVITAFRPAVPVNRVERTITINGAVRRPGTYELMPHENLKTLIEVYGDDFTPLADKSRLELVRYVGSSSTAGDKLALSREDVDRDFALRHYDVVTVPNIADLRPVLFVEGAVSTRGAVVTREGIEESAGEGQDELSGSSRLVVPFNRGEDYAALVRRNKRWFSAVSDTRNAYVVRGDERVPLNLNPMLYDENYRGVFPIEENDTLIIPFRQYFVTVAGAVENPGRYPYIPDREWDYYIALAGGFVPGRNALESVTIRDIAGKRMRKTEIITPETIITAHSNNGLYYFNQWAPVLTTALTVISTLITTIMLVTR